MLTAHAHAGEKDHKHPLSARHVFCGQRRARLFNRNTGNGGSCDFVCIKKRTRYANCHDRPSTWRRSNTASPRSTDASNSLPPP